MTNTLMQTEEAVLQDCPTNLFTWNGDPEALSLHQVKQNFVWWAMTDTTPVLDGVDEQAVALQGSGGYGDRPHNMIVLWPVTSDGSGTAAAKDYLGSVMRAKTARLERPQVGQTVYLTEEGRAALFGADPVPQGFSGQLLRDDRDANPFLVQWDRRFPRGGGLSLSSSYMREGQITTTPPLDGPTLDTEETPEGVVVDAKDARIEELEQSLRTAQEQYEQSQRRAREVQNEHEHDIIVIGDALIAEATNRGWCSEYDEIIERLNLRLHRSLPERESEYEVTWTETYTVTVSRSGTYTARDADGAVEYAQEDEGDTTYDITRALEAYGMNVSDVQFESDGGDFEATPA